MKAMLIIDIQEGLTSKKGLHKTSLFFETVNSAIKKYREQKQMLIFVHHNNNQLRSGTKEWEIDKRIDKWEGDMILQKQHGNAFEKTELKSLLLQKNIKELLVCGLVTHGCIRATCLGGINEGFDTCLLSSGHTNWNKDAESKISLTESELCKAGIKLLDIQDI